MKTLRFRDQLGIGLVELMVALVVSTILLSGVIQIFISSKLSYRMLDGYSRLQENGRFAVDTLSRNIRLAGYRSDIWSSEETEFPQTTPGGGVYANNGQVIFGTDDVSDSIEFRYKGQGSGNGFIDDCLGSNITAGNTVSMIFSITSDNTLQCQVPGVNTQPIVDGVENMQILYGVDTSVPGNRFANRFDSATVVTANSNWGNVVSVRIALLLNTVNNVSTQNDSKSYDLNGVTIAAGADGLRRHRFMTTINLRNRVRL